MTIWRRSWACKACGNRILKTLSKKPDKRTPCPVCRAADGWRAGGFLRLVCAEEGCEEDARCGSGLCRRHELRAQKIKKSIGE